MRNIIIISQALTGGGAEKLAANLSLELAKSNNVVLVTYRQDKDEYSYAGTRINIDRFGGQGGVFRHIINAINRILDIRKIKKQYKSDCAISFLPQTDYANILSKIKGEKTIIDVVSNMSFVYPNGLSRLFRQFIIKKSDFVVTVSEGVRTDLVKNFGIPESKCKTIYNSVNIDMILNCCKTEPRTLNAICELPEKYICSMGSFRMAKGHWHLIKAFASIADKIPDYKLVILGDGDYRSKYNELIKKLGIEDKVIMPGFINPPYSVIHKSTLFIFSSVFEGFGHSIIEAIACGIPVLSADFNYGAREIIEPGSDIEKKATGFEKCKYGYLLPPFSMDDIDIEKPLSAQERLMGEAILKVLESDNKELIERGLRYVNKFDNVAYGKHWVEVIEGLINE